MSYDRLHPSSEEPIGQLVIQTIAMPQDTNPNGDIFGGWLVSQMDLGSSIAAKVRCRGRTATVAIEKLSFYRPVQVGDTVQVFANLERVGRTSMRFHVQSWATPLGQPPAKLVAEGVFTFVAIDDTGRPREVPVE